MKYEFWIKRDILASTHLLLILEARACRDDVYL